MHLFGAKNSRKQKNWLTPQLTSCTGGKQHANNFCNCNLLLQFNALNELLTPFHPHNISQAQNLAQEKYQVSTGWTKLFPERHCTRGSVCVWVSGQGWGIRCFSVKAQPGDNILGQSRFNLFLVVQASTMLKRLQTANQANY